MRSTILRTRSLGHETYLDIVFYYFWPYNMKMQRRIKIGHHGRVYV